ARVRPAVYAIERRESINRGNLIGDLFPVRENVWIGNSLMATIKQVGVSNADKDLITTSRNQHFVDPVRRNGPDPVYGSRLIGTIKNPRCEPRLIVEGKGGKLDKVVELGATSDRVVLGRVVVNGDSVLTLVLCFAAFGEPVCCTGTIKVRLGESSEEANATRAEPIFRNNVAVEWLT